MPGVARYHSIPLPNGWPRCVRSAVIRVIPLAHFSLITTRSRAADSWDSYPAGTTFAGAGLSPAGTMSLCTAHLAYFTRLETDSSLPLIRFLMSPDSGASATRQALE